MTYTIDLNNQGVLLRRPSPTQGIKVDFAVILISFLTAAGSAWYINSIGVDKVESNIPVILLFAGIILAVGNSLRVITAPSRLKKYVDQIFFNNTQSTIEIFHSTSNAKKIAIPYANIKSISPRLHIRYSGTGTDRKSSTWYSAAIYLKDGTAWDLSDDSFSHMDYASDWIEKWVHHVNLKDSNSSENILIPSLETEKFSILRRADELQVLWRNNYPNQITSILAPPLIAFAIINFVGFMMMSSEGPDFEMLISNLKNLTDFAQLPELLGGLMFILPIWIAFLTWLIVSVSRIMIFKLKRNKIVVNSAGLSYSNLKLKNVEIGTVSMDYTMKSDYRSIDFHREVVEHYKQSVSISGETIDMTDGSGHSQRTLKGDHMEDLSLKNWLKSIPQQIKESKKQLEYDTHNHLGTIAFDRFSPVDVYIVKECIRKHLLM